jgi:hypothetical protein
MNSTKIAPATMLCSILVFLGSLVPIQALAADPSEGAIDFLKHALEMPGTSLAGLADKGFARVPLSKADAATAREMVWRAHVDAVRRDRSQEFKERVLKEGNLSMPFAFKSFGDKPKTGRSLWISMHGGGEAPVELNDEQWENQKNLYTLGEGIYLAPRAPTDAWNMWSQAHIDRLFSRLIEDLIVLEGVDSDRVYVMGYSAGGDGVYQLAPRMADRWAAAAMMAGHPNGVSMLSVRNVPFALQVGGNDSAYDRNKIAVEYGAKLDDLQKHDPKGYVHAVKIWEGKPHWMDGEDKIALPWMANFTRDPVPSRIVWKQTGAPHERSYWLAVPPGTAKNDSLVIAQRDAQKVELAKLEGVTTLLVRFDERTADLDKPITITRAGTELYSGKAPRTIGTLIRTLVGYGDPKLMFDAEIKVELRPEK